jgi:hypothetical protein
MSDWMRMREEAQAWEQEHPGYHYGCSLPRRYCKCRDPKWRKLIQEADGDPWKIGQAIQGRIRAALKEMSEAEIRETPFRKPHYAQWGQEEIESRKGEAPKTVWERLNVG